MTSTFKKDVSIGIAAGIAAAIIGINFIGIMAAVSVPKWLISDGNVGAKLLAWDILVVQVLGIGVISAAVSYSVVRLFSSNWLRAAITICFVILCFSLLYSVSKRYFW